MDTFGFVSETGALARICFRAANTLCGCPMLSACPLRPTSKMPIINKVFMIVCFEVQRKVMGFVWYLV